MTKLGISRNPGYYCYEKKIPLKLSGLKESQSFYCLSWFLWVRDSGWAGLGGPDSGSLRQVQCRGGWSWHGRGLTWLFSPCCLSLLHAVSEWASLSFYTLGGFRVIRLLTRQVRTPA